MTDERGLSVRRSRVVLTPRCWRQVLRKLTLLRGDGGKKAGHRGELEVSRKTIAQGRPECFRWTCMLVCAFLKMHLHARPRVQRAPGLPCALNLCRGHQTTQSSGASRRENANAHPVVIVRLVRNRALGRTIQYSREHNDGN